MATEDKKVCDDGATDNSNLNALETIEMLILQSSSHSTIRWVVQQILDQALDPLSAQTVSDYATLCKQIYFVSTKHDISKQKLFHRQLLCLCNDYFANKRHNGDIDGVIAIIVLFGELFNNGLVPWSTINLEWFARLIPPNSAMDIEAACKLLCVAGRTIDGQYHKELDLILAILSDHVQNFEYRVQYLVNHVLELRTNDWKISKLEKKNKEFLKLNLLCEQFKASSIASPTVTPKYSESYETQQQQQQSTTKSPPNIDIDAYEYNNFNQQTTSTTMKLCRVSTNGNGNGYSNGNGSNHHSRWRRNNRMNHDNNGNDWGYRRRCGCGHSNGGNHFCHLKRKRNKKLKSSVRFIRDVTIPDRSPHPPNKILTKKWIILNNGECDWGSEVELVYFKGDVSLSLQHRYPVVNAQPGQTVEIYATIRTPIKKGRYCTYFRLWRYGKFFGPRFWVDILVTHSLQESESNSDETVPSKPNLMSYEELTEQEIDNFLFADN